MVRLSLLVLGVVWFAFLGRLSMMRYHGRSRFTRRFAFLAGYAVWPRRYDSLVVALQSAFFVAFGAAFIFVARST